MQKLTKYIPKLLSLLFVLFVFGCGGNGSLGKKVMELSETGVSINIPEGWRLDNSQMCHKGDNTGILMEEGLGNQIFEQRADQMSKEFGSTVISESKMTVNGHNAIKVVANTASGDVLLRIYIHKGDKIIWLSFVILKAEFSEIEQALQKSIQSIKIKT